MTKKVSDHESAMSAHEGELTPAKIASMKKLAESNFTKFAFAVQEMSSEVRIKLIEQLPEFRELAKQSLTTLSDAFEKTLDSNDTSEKEIYAGYRSLIDALLNMLNKENLSLDEQFAITNKIGEVNRELVEIDKTNKQFKLQMFGKIATGALVVAAVVVAAVAGGKVALDSSDSA